MLRKLSLLFVSTLLVVCSALAQTGQGTLKGSVLDGKTKEPIPFANIVVTQGGEMKGGVTTDFDGKFILNQLSPGSYDVEIKYVGYKTTKYDDDNDNVYFEKPHAQMSNNCEKLIVA